MYCVKHQDWVDAEGHDPPDWGIPLQDSASGEPLEYVLDPSVDMIPQSRAATAFEPDRIDESVVYQRLAQVFNSDREHLSVPAGVSGDSMEQFLRVLRTWHEL